MTEKKDETYVAAKLLDAVEVIDLGDAVDETKQLVPHGLFPDCQFAIGARPGCG